MLSEAEIADIATLEWADWIERDGKAFYPSDAIPLLLKELAAVRADQIEKDAAIANAGSTHWDSELVQWRGLLPAEIAAAIRAQLPERSMDV